MLAKFPSRRLETQLSRSRQKYEVCNIFDQKIVRLTFQQWTKTIKRSKTAVFKRLFQLHIFFSLFASLRAELSIFRLIRSKPVLNITPGPLSHLSVNVHKLKYMSQLFIYWEKKNTVFFESMVKDVI